MASIDLSTDDGILSYLRQYRYPQCSEVVRLTGGSTGFVYRATTHDTTTPSVVVKHAEGYAARASSWKLDPNRMEYEVKAMLCLSQPRMRSNTVRVPKLLHYDKENHVLIMEDAGPLSSLKTWTAAGVDVASCTQIGRALGQCLAQLHNATYNHQELLREFDGNETAKSLSGKLYFGGLAAAAEKFGFTDDFIADAARAGEAEVMQSSEVLTMGDFWTGNVLVSSRSSQQDLHLYVLDWELSKPGTAEFDIGQMAAEMWCLAAFRKNAREQGLALLEAFLSAYKASRSAPVDAAKVAVRIGAHLFVIMPMAWSGEATEEQVEKAASEAREFVRMGWERDEDAITRSVLARLT